MFNSNLSTSSDSSYISQLLSSIAKSTQPMLCQSVLFFSFLACDISKTAEPISIKSSRKMASGLQYKI